MLMTPKRNSQWVPALLIGVVAIMLAVSDTIVLKATDRASTVTSLVVIMAAWGAALALTRRGSPWRRLRAVLLMAVATWLSLRVMGDLDQRPADPAGILLGLAAAAACWSAVAYTCIQPEAE